MNLSRMPVNGNVWAPEFRGFVGGDNIAAISQRWGRIFTTGRRFTLVRQRSVQRADQIPDLAEVTPGLHLVRLVVDRDPYGATLNAELAQDSASLPVWVGVRAECAHYHHYIDDEADARVPMTAAQVREVASRGGYPGCDVFWVEIDGGLPENDIRPGLHRIRVYSRNQHGYEEWLQLVPNDAPREDAP